MKVTGVDEPITAQNDAERALTSPARVPVAPSVRARHRDALRAAMASDHAATSSSGGRRALLREPGTVVPDQSRGRGRRRVTVVVTAAVVVTVVGGGLAAALTKLRPSEPAMVRCFAVATTDFDNPGLAFDLGVAAPPGGAAPSAAAQALDQCGQAWYRGEVSSRAPHLPRDFTGGGQPIPHLVACVLPPGFVGVFPGPAGTCAALGLPESAP